MTVDDLCGKLAALFPFFFNDAYKAGERVELYRQSLTALEGDRLAEAYRRTMASWKKGEPPMPGHFAENIPTPAKVTVHEDPGFHRGEDETDRLMRPLVGSSLGRQIVAEGLASYLEDLVRRRDVSIVGDLSRGLIDRLKASRAKFDASQRDLDETQMFASTLRSMSEKLRARADRSNAKWAEYLQTLENAA